MGNAVLVVLSMTIGFFFILMGLLKITTVNEDIYRELRKTFIRSAKVFPFIVQTGWSPNPHIYRKVISTIEILCGTLLAIVPGPLKEAANVVLLVVMFGGGYTHYALGDSLEKMTPALVFGLLLACRLIVVAQVTAREKREQMEEAALAAAAGRTESKKTQ